MFTKNTTASAALIALALAAGACTTSDDGASSITSITTSIAETTPDTTPVTTPETTSGTTPETTPGTAPARTDVDAIVAGAIERIAAGYSAVEGVWAGFVPNDHPVVIPFRSTSGDLQAVIAINHPDPDALGDAAALDTASTPFASLHRIENPTDRTALEQLEGFDFHARLGGVDSFAMIAGGSDAFFDPLTADYTSTLLHEMFHRYQDEAFEGSIGNQDVEGYAYTAENLELAVLEDRALRDVLKAESDTAREAAARRFAAIRLARRAADPRVVLDDDQERYEGSARFLEHRFAADDTEFAYHGGNFDRELTVSFGSQVKDIFGFGRFYASGAAVLQTLDLLGVESIAERIEADESPADILIDHLGVETGDAAALVDEARANYDPRNELAAAASTAAEQAADEPPVFGPDAGGGADADDGQGSEITDDEIECLEDQGVDFDADNVTISDAQFEACVG